MMLDLFINCSKRMEMLDLFINCSKRMEENRFVITSNNNTICMHPGLCFAVALVFPCAHASAATCTQHNNMIIGNSFIKKMSTPSADACCSACFEYGYACQAFTYQLSTKDCKSMHS